MHLSTVIVSLVASASALQTPSLASCKKLKGAVGTVQKDVVHEVRFCGDFLAAQRKTSPLPGMTASELTKACACVLKQNGKRVPKNQSPDNTPKKQRAKCNAKYEKSIKKEFRFPKNFCQFYGAYPRAQSFLGGLSSKQVAAGCECFLEATKPTTKKTSSTASHALTSGTASGTAAPIAAPATATPTASPAQHFARFYSGEPTGVAPTTIPTQHTLFPVSFSAYQAAEACVNYAAAESLKSFIIVQSVNPSLPFWLCAGWTYTTDSTAGWVANPEAGAVFAYSLSGTDSGPASSSAAATTQTPSPSALSSTSMAQITSATTETASSASATATA